MPTLKELAKESGLSQSTLSRAFNHCSGTGEEVARIAYDLQIKYDLNPFEYGLYEVGVILPEAPKYFWSLAKDTLRSCLLEHGVKFRPAYIESMRSGYLALNILREMEERGVSLVIMPYIPDCAEYISTSAMRFFFLCEPYDAENTFSFCADSYRDGLHLGQLMREHLPERNRIVVVRGINETTTPRLRGFEEVMGRERICAQLSQPAVNLHLLPSVLAREFAALNVEFDTICCLSGFTHRAGLAVHKLGKLDDVVIVGFESPSPDNPYIQDGTIAALMVQDIAAQARAAAEAAVVYTTTGELPKQQYTLIESTPKIFTQG